jgi:uncharacterized protein (TIGR00369 family)
MADDSAAPMPPEGFAKLTLRPSGFLQAIGPFWGRRGPEGLSIGLRIEPRHCNSAGLAHGGMLLSLVDVVLTVGSNHDAGTRRFLPTVNVTCDFIRGVPLGSWVQGRAEVLRVAGSHVFSQMVLTDPAGTVFVRASGVLILRGEPDEAFAPSSLFPSLSTDTKGPE